jgi:dihydrofolate reductase
VVFSRTLDNATWNNTRLIREDPASAVRRMKRESGPDMLIFGSGTIVSQLTQAGLIDEFQIVLNPIVLGAGRTMFEGLTTPLRLKRTKSRAFGNGNTVLSYEPAR